MNTDLITCPCCGSDACSKTINNDGVEVHLCWTCGMTTNSLMEDGSDFEKENYEKVNILFTKLKERILKR